ncbi:hypothetical protein GM418_12195 [Maribellus comscasis]|uniref:Periplasmic heavy metal sensor n=1 Tax=Maribellus comscasis TaxID=2681766 RepID=A0A6I6JTG5_9BACT|nr:hypothetical protein [Maribellus comscasis]QGY44390.1 hypothetical protein GM418_12195 [Maribellus comscasis]
MKISKLQKFAWVFLALALGTSTLFAQGWRNGNRAFAQNNEKITCLNYLSDLTDEQVESITALENKHQEQMDVLRDKRRATTNWDEKDIIREEMLENVVGHRMEVKKLLTEDQQKEYELLQLRGNNYRNQRMAYQRGNGAGYGNQQGFARGNRGGSRGAGYGRGYYRNCPRFN